MTNDNPQAEHTMNDRSELQPFIDLALSPWRAAMSAAQAWPATFAPNNLTQPINPGWTFGNVIQVNESNSTAPHTEQEIVRRHSYGRQIGRMMDAVDLLIEHAPAAVKKDRRAIELLKIERDVDAIKREQAAQRLERLREELLSLKRSDPKGWAALRQLLAD